jgi:hypothetical protein
MADYLAERHFRRKHGPDAYYGQGLAPETRPEPRPGHAGEEPK